MDGLNCKGRILQYFPTGVRFAEKAAGRKNETPAKENIWQDNPGRGFLLDSHSMQRTIFLRFKTGLTRLFCYPISKKVHYDTLALRQVPNS